MKVAIVGSEEKYWTQDQKAEARWFIIGLLADTNVTLVSGRCPKGGVDVWAEEIADFLGRDKRIFPPEVHRWNDRGPLKGYKSRNIQIAETCDILVDIEPTGRRSGGYWTLKRAKEMGKPVSVKELD